MPPHRCRHPCSSGHGLAVTMGPGKSHPPLSKGSTRHMEKEMLLLSSSRSCLGTRCFFQMSILPQGFSRFPASIAIALLQLDWRFTTQLRPAIDVVQHSAPLTPAHYQSDRTAPPGRPGLAWNAPRSRGRQQLGHLQRQHQRLVSFGSCLLSSSPSFFQGCKDAKH